MFLAQLYQHSKWLFTCLVAFLLAMLLINYKWGITAAPVHQYGMYSAKTALTDIQQVYELSVNGRPVDITRYNTFDRDMLLVSIEDFEKQQRVNEEAYATMKNIFRRAGLAGIMREQQFLGQVSPVQFTSWYKEQLQKRSGYRVDSFSIFKRPYIWKDDRLTAVGQLQLLYHWN